MLWTLGGIATAGSVGYVIVEQNRVDPPALVASLSQPVEELKKPAAVEPKVKIAKEPEAPATVLPKFDILRVEKDGSAVIAGSAPAGSKVEILDGDTVIATADAGPSGQFVIVLDVPLTPGTHELHIQATSKNADPIHSAEAGIINIPEKGRSDLLAMVIKPGKASRILQKPKPQAKAAEPEVVEVPEPAPVEEVAEAAEPDPVVTEIAEPDVAEPVTPEEPAPVEVVKLEEPAKIEVVKPGPVKVPVLIEAAEVEGDNVFIAGSGQPGTIVQLYMDGKHIGSAEIGNEGAFLFEGTGGLKAGRYAVRADMVDKKTATVIARAEVSLLHEPVVVKPVEVASLENEPVEPAPEPVVAATKPVVEPVVVPVSEPVAETQAVVTPIEPKPEVTSKVEPAPQTAKPQIVTVAEPQVKEVTKVLEIVAAEPAAPSQVTQVAVADPVETPEPIIKEPVIKEIVTGSSVIIRRGDNLWRVSRRKWGQGIRYTVIFEANREQIRDPHWIYPGQVFKIPKIASDEESSQAG